MKEKVDFIGYRGNITVEDISMYNTEYADSSTMRNKLFRNFFEELENKGSLETTYTKRKYILIFKENVNDIVHCQIARKREVSINKLNGNEINETIEEDYPYVNFFVDLPSQKILIEINSSVFDNNETGKKIIENVMKAYFNKHDVLIDINPITEEYDFWQMIKENEKVYKITFELNAPNWGNSANAAKEFAEDTKRLGADKTLLTISNKDGNLYADEEVIGSFIKYIAEGAGTWQATLKTDAKGKSTIKSGQKTKKLSLEISRDDLNDKIDELELQILKNTFNKIEAVESLRR